MKHLKRTLALILAVCLTSGAALYVIPGRGSKTANEPGYAATDAELRELSGDGVYFSLSSESTDIGSSADSSSTSDADQGDENSIDDIDSDADAAVDKENDADDKQMADENNVVEMDAVDEMQEADVEKAANEDSINTLETKGANYSITASYGSDAELPEDTTLNVTPIEENTEQYQNRLKEAQEKLGADDLISFQLFDISLVQNGKETEPNASVQVTMNFQSDDFAGAENATVIHFDESNGAEVVETQAINCDADGNVFAEFEAERFSEYAVALHNYDNITDGYYILYIYANINNTGDAPYAIKYDGNTVNVTYSNGEIGYNQIDDIKWKITKEGDKYSIYNEKYKRWLYPSKTGTFATSTKYVSIPYGNPDKSIDGVTVKRGLIKAYDTEYKLKQSGSNLSSATDGSAKIQFAELIEKFTIQTINSSQGTVTGINSSNVNTKNANSYTSSIISVTQNSQNKNVNAYSIKATAKTGYKFKKWQLMNGADFENNTTYYLPAESLELASGDVLTAVFEADTSTSGSSGSSGGEQEMSEVEKWLDELQNNRLTGDKTAQVYDYDNRIYEIGIDASSGLRVIDPDIELVFIADVSRSMYFPARLDKVANYGGNLYDWLNSSSASTDQVYYVIGNPGSDSTVYALQYTKNYSDGSYKLDSEKFSPQSPGQK